MKVRPERQCDQGTDGQALGKSSRAAGERGDCLPAALCAAGSLISKSPKDMLYPEGQAWPPCLEGVGGGVSNTVNPPLGDLWSPCWTILRWCPSSHWKAGSLRAETRTVLPLPHPRP